MVGCKNITGKNLKFLKKKFGEDLERIRISNCNPSFEDTLNNSGLSIRVIESSSVTFFEKEVIQEIGEIVKEFGLSKNSAIRKRQRSGDAVSLNDNCVKKKRKKMNAKIIGNISAGSNNARNDLHLNIQSDQRSMTGIPNKLEFEI